MFERVCWDTLKLQIIPVIFMIITKKNLPKILANMFYYHSNSHCVHLYSTFIYFTLFPHWDKNFNSGQRKRWNMNWPIRLHHVWSFSGFCAGGISLCCLLYVCTLLQHPCAHNPTSSPLTNTQLVSFAYTWLHTLWQSGFKLYTHIKPFSAKGDIQLIFFSSVILVVFFGLKLLSVYYEFATTLHN